ncbi:MAG TPA: type II toxin-antitoxin system RelE/ParE family toxin [Candidatus Kapabacteria bacterium]
MPFEEWFRSLPTPLRQIVSKRLDRIEDGNFGDSEPVGDGVSELRIHIEKGLRVYYGQEGRRVVILLVGGDKSTQRKDIQNAKAYWNDWKQRGTSSERPVGAAPT